MWFIEKYMKTGKCNTEFAAYYIDQYWKQKPFAAVRNHHTLSNHDFFVSKKAFFLTYPLGVMNRLLMSRTNR